MTKSQIFLVVLFTVLWMCYLCADAGTSCASDCTKDCPGNCGGDGTCRKSSGRCRQGCKDGWHKGKCRARCPKGCSGENNPCERNTGSCIEGCDQGKRGDNCDIPCSKNCGGDKSCDRESGRCLQGCISGKHGDLCDMYCPATCTDGRQCNRSTGHCTIGCTNGTYGVRCGKNCPSGCAEGRKCHRTTGQCTAGCISGKHGDWCNQDCPRFCGGEGQCNRTNKHCSLGCSSGKYGDLCFKDCPVYCADGRKCNRTTGKCTTGCSSGRYGDLCEKLCSPSCPGSGGCHRATGSCSEDCRPGIYGAFCNLTCPNCEGDRRCNRTTGHCLTDCRPGMYGAFCNLTCPNCEGDKRCNRILGHCLADCRPGIYGAFCNLTCPNCDGDRRCNRTTGHCLTDCRPGDNTCDPAPCPKNCEGKCHPDGNCSECKEGNYGNKCQHNCSDKCLTNCHQKDGACQVCREGFYGVRCTDRCPENCREGCSIISGHCIRCKENFNGTTCSECVNGKYGVRCDTSCPENCTASCHKENGTCYNCKPGFYGDKCDKACGEGCAGNGSCKQEDGTCTCQAGYKANKCADCEDTRYGPKCGKVCPSECSAGCDKGNGTCLACPRNRYGERCDRICWTGCERSSCVNDKNCTCEENLQGNRCEECVPGKYGISCDKTCLAFCYGRCNRTTGNCSCPAGTYGDNCEKTCWPGCKENTCNRNVQQCECKEEFEGPKCERADGSMQGVAGEKKHTAVMVAVPIACVIIVAVLAVLLIVWFRRGRPKFWKKTDPENAFLENHTNAAFEVNEDNVDSIPSYQNLSACVAVDAFPKHVEALTKKRNGFDDDFQEIPANPIHSWNVGILTKNYRKNRFTNVIAYDHNRVKLTTNGDDDYVNASYMNTPEAPKQFIAAQGPNPESVDDFVLMLFEQEVPLVVMVTNLKEKKKSKCERYWPTDEGEEEIFGEVNVKMTSETKMPHYITRQLILEKDEKAHELTQLQYISWPDHGVPANAASFLNFHEDAAKLYAFHKGPTVVHCSAGVGRTGTFLAMDYLLQQADEEGKIDIPKYINEMRDRRVLMVQSLSQYVFIHECLLEALHCGKTVYPVDTCNAEELLSSPDLATQYEMLDIMKIPVWPNDVEYGSILNKHKDREGTPVPRDSRRPDLVTVVKGHDEYINAVLAQGYSEDDKVVVTQSPIENTVVDFWRLVYDCECGVILALNETDIDDYPGYLPEEEQVYGCFEVTPLACEKTGNYIKRKLMLKRKEEELVVYHIRPQTMPTPQELPEIPTMLSVLEEINNLKREADENGLLIHCQQGVEFSGLFCVLGNVIEKINHEQEIGVFHAVKQARLSRPEFITSMDQYKWLHQAAGAYIETLTTYANFQTPESPEK